MMGIISKPLGALLFFIYNFTQNYGIALIIFTIIVRCCLLPLYLSQIKHTSKLGEMQPKMAELQQKYGHDKETYNKKIMELYSETGANPAKGCLPMLIQFPIIIGLFSLLREPLKYMSDPTMILAVHESFLWVSDLSQPDPWILPFLAGIAMFFSFSASSMGTVQTPQTAGSMKLMKFIFPVMIFLWGKSFPAGLTMYWFIGSIYQIIQTFFLNRYKKIKALEREIEEEDIAQKRGKRKKK